MRCSLEYADPALAYEMSDLVEEWCEDNEVENNFDLSCTNLNRKNMTQPTIYLCYEMSSEYKRLVYLGENLEDCIAQLRQEFDLVPSDCENLRNDMQTFGFEKDSELLIEEERLNCFSNNWNSYEIPRF